MQPEGIRALAAALRDGRTTPRRLLDDAVAHLRLSEPSLHAYLATTFEQAGAQADAAARRLEEDPADAPLLCGIPMALKDVLCVEGIETTAASRILKGFRPPYTATAAQRLFDAGAVCVGKTNCDEFAMGSSN
ncbi:MAG: Asp-tRNA(Asn)/Glu-tRNA(Gln) amidotransferase subunit GatA, partial [Candidatus Dormibacteraeota bacterium]|nr:Asp-tRNA(Asn)/Glu-tRNA(Gln) amidotransferase subunit GatA [Candidatus Dormibacteraeota bacterium]